MDVGAGIVACIALVQVLKDPAQRQALVDTYDRLAQATLRPFPEMEQDPIRQEVDATVAQALGLPDLTILRELLAREPVVCLQPLV